jgi:hypothetical protein
LSLQIGNIATQFQAIVTCPPYCGVIFTSVELRTLHESDSRALQEKSQEVDRLREEVEQLARDVEVLRTVVKERLKERRLVR